MQENFQTEQSSSSPQMQIYICARCGRENPIGVNYCSWCNSPLSSFSVEAPRFRSRIAPLLVSLTTVAVLVVLAILVISFGWISGPTVTDPTLASLPSSSSQPAAPTTRPISTPTLVLADGPPSDVHAFADYVELVHPNLGNRPLAFTGKDANYVGGHPQIFLGLGPSSVDYVLFDASRADVRAWGDAVATDAKKAWPDQDYSIVLDWTFYTEDSCSGCAGYCQFQSPTFTAGKGWFHADFAVNIFRDLSSELVIACAGK